MSLEYAETRIKEALKLAKGNQARARQQIIAWAVEDPKLLFALTKPHLSGIVAYNIERVASGRAAAAKETTSAPQRPMTQKAAPAGQKAKPEQFGLEILKAVAGNPEIFGLEDFGVPQKREQASARHIAAIKAIAAKSKHTKKT
jgi:hypothetical protein